MLAWNTSSYPSSWCTDFLLSLVVVDSDIMLCASYGMIGDRAWPVTQRVARTTASPARKKMSRPVAFVSVVLEFAISTFTTTASCGIGLSICRVAADYVNHEAILPARTLLSGCDVHVECPADAKPQSRRWERVEPHPWTDIPNSSWS